jgi:diaminopimelate epimerase
MVGHDGAPVSTSGQVPRSGLLDRLRGLAFVKMTGSGNDFVFFDGRTTPIDLVTQPEAIAAICNRYNGIGADGLVVLEPLYEEADVRVHYYNSDGTAADLCGNATLCSTTISAQWELASPSGMRLSTGAGLINSRLDGLPAISLQPVTTITPDMPIALAAAHGSRVGFAVAGIPHLVILCEDADAVDVVGAGPALRRHEATGPAGANVNWVSPRPDGSWRYRTFERGVEGETLACGTGAVATAVLLRTWGISGNALTTTIRTSSGRDVEVDLEPLNQQNDGPPAGFRPTLRGEGRVVFQGEIAAL